MKCTKPTSCWISLLSRYIVQCTIIDFLGAHRTLSVGSTGLGLVERLGASSCALYIMCSALRVLGSSWIFLAASNSMVNRKGLQSFSVPRALTGWAWGWEFQVWFSDSDFLRNPRSFYLSAWLFSEFRLLSSGSKSYLCPLRRHILGQERKKSGVSPLCFFFFSLSRKEKPCA